MGRLQSYLGNNDLAQKQLDQAFDLFKRYEEIELPARRMHTVKHLATWLKSVTQATS